MTTRDDLVDELVQWGTGGGTAFPHLVAEATLKKIEASPWFREQRQESAPEPAEPRYGGRVLGEWTDTEPCDRCGQTFPGDHEQHIDSTPGEMALVFWTCPIIE